MFIIMSDVSIHGIPATFMKEFPQRISHLREKKRRYGVQALKEVGYVDRFEVPSVIDSACQAARTRRASTDRCEPRDAIAPAAVFESHRVSSLQSVT